MWVHSSHDGILAVLHTEVLHHLRTSTKSYQCMSYRRLNIKLLKLIFFYIVFLSFPFLPYL
jgi:hypothetical protein